MTTRPLLATLAGVALAGAISLSGCVGTPSSSPSSTSDDPGSDTAEAFLGCLTASDVQARLNESGQVLVKVPEGSGDGGAVSSGENLLGMEGDEAGNTWVAAVDATYFADFPDIQDAYSACEESHPGFTQAQFEPEGSPEMAEEVQEQEADALVFAECARENGYSQIADPDFSATNGILIPDGFTETEFRALIEACWDPTSTYSFGARGDISFEPWTVLEEFQNAPAS